MEKNRSVIIKMGELWGQIVTPFTATLAFTPTSLGEKSVSVRWTCWLHVYKCVHLHLFVAAQECTWVWRPEVNFRCHVSGAVHILCLDRISYSETWGPSIMLDWVVMEPWAFSFQLASTGIVRCTTTLGFICQCERGEEAASTWLTEVPLQLPARTF